MHLQGNIWRTIKMAPVSDWSLYRCTSAFLCEHGAILIKVQRRRTGAASMVVMVVCCCWWGCCLDENLTSLYLGSHVHTLVQWGQTQSSFLLSVLPGHHPLCPSGSVDMRNPRSLHLTCTGNFDSSSKAVWGVGTEIFTALSFKFRCIDTCRTGNWHGLDCQCSCNMAMWS